MTRKVLLVGGGHSHVLSLLLLPKLCPPKTQFILISDSCYAPYSGMTPGFIAGQFSREECLIDLPALCKKVGAQWQQAAAVTIDSKNKTVKLNNGAVEEFDVLSVNVGGAPKPFFEHGIAVKPAQTFMAWLDKQTISSVAIIGAGAGGVETALALRHRFATAKISLIGDKLLPGGNNGTRQRLTPILQARDIDVFESAAVKLENNTIMLADGRQVLAEEIIYATSVAAAAWLKQSDLTLDDNGFVQVNEYLQSVSSEAVFAAGDCAASGAPKSGVIAVRQAPVLAHNIAAILNNTPLQKWQMQKRRLFILNTADGGAIAGWGGLAAAGKWVWQWKYYLDKKFMNKFLP
ncbi:MAG: FAD-dependent oxidoreductase [Gammaproteobacteria bacterium WSBS_2016_MAG_OTU1]